MPSDSHSSNPSSTALSTEEDLITLLDLSDSFLALQTTLAASLSTGLFSISQAKYILGPDAVGPGSFDYRTEASLGVISSQKSVDVHTLRRIPLEEGESKEEKGTELRKRRGEINSKEGEDDSTKEDDVEGRDESKVDPLQWFGLLAPQCLRDAQVEFRRVTQIAVKLASISARMCELEQRLSNTTSAS